MASKYKAEFDLPAEFPSILKAFTREVLRHQPENVYEFGAQYFDDLIKAQAAAESGAARRLSPQELEELLGQLFAEHDADGNGYLDHREFRELLHTANLGLSKREVKRVLAEADENEDGQIEYAEFVPIAIELVQAMYAKADAAAAKGEQEEAARQSAEAHLIHGMPREAIEALMSDVFYKADLDGSGALSRREFHACLREADLGLTRQEINLIMAEVDADGDGARAAAARPSPRQTAADALAPPASSALRARRPGLVRRVCAALPPDLGRDPQGRDGRLAALALRARALPPRADGLGRPRRQRAARRARAQGPHPRRRLWAHAPADPHRARRGRGGRRRPRRVRAVRAGRRRPDLPAARPRGAGQQDGGAPARVEGGAGGRSRARSRLTLAARVRSARAAQAVRSLTSATGGSLLLHNLNQAAMADALTALFEEADASQSSSLPKAEVKRLLLECELGLSAKEVQCLISAADVDVDGAIMYHSLALAAHRQLAYLDVQHSAQ